MLSEDLKSAIKRYYNQHRSYRKTAVFFRISKDTVRRVVLNLYTEVKKKPGPDMKLTRRDETRIKKFIRSEVDAGRRVTAAKIKETLQLTVNKSTISRHLNRMKFFYQEFVKTLPLSKEHRKARIKFVRDLITDAIDYKKIVFSDEKRFSLDGPDNYMSYQDTHTKNAHRTKSSVRIKRQSGGGSVMILGYITYEGDFEIKILPSHYKAVNYLDDLKEIIESISFKYGVNNKIWQQDNCTVHTAKIVMDYFKEYEINHLIWPSRSPDLNIIENLWQVMSTIVYSNGQFRTRNDLISALKNAAVLIRNEKKDVIKSLYDSFPNRIVDILKFKGSKLKY